jgi:hypothetical protein
MVYIEVPKNQTRWVTYMKNGEPKYISTINSNKDRYTLYKVDTNGGLQKLRTSVSPLFKECGY